MEQNAATSLYIQAGKTNETPLRSARPILRPRAPSRCALRDTCAASRSVARSRRVHAHIPRVCVCARNRGPRHLPIYSRGGWHVPPRLCLPVQRIRRGRTHHELSSAAHARASSSARTHAPLPRICSSLSTALCRTVPSAVILACFLFSLIAMGNRSKANLGDLEELSASETGF